MYAHYTDLQSAVEELKLENVESKYDTISTLYEIATFSSRNHRCTITCTKFSGHKKIRTFVDMRDIRGNSIRYESEGGFILVEKQEEKFYLCVCDLKIRIDGNKKEDYICN